LQLERAVRLVLGLLVTSFVAGCCPRPTPADGGAVLEVTGPKNASCHDPEEPNDVTVDAQFLPAGCSGTLSGLLAGEGDLDYFQSINDCSRNAPATLNLTSVGEDTRACLFIACHTGTTDFVSCGPMVDGAATGNAWIGIDPTGLRGCCRKGPGIVTVTTQCPGTVKTSSIVRVDQPNDNQCTNYQIEYHFD
jgi:hypothetical protein